MAKRRAIGGLRVPVQWREPLTRPGFDVTYTAIGGSLNGEPELKATEQEVLAIGRLRSQVLLAVTPGESTDPDVQFFCAVARKILQRGANPTIPAALFGQTELKLVDPLLNGDLTSHDIFRSVTEGKLPIELDSEIEIHETYELPVWENIIAQAPLLSRFVTPQALMSSLVGEEHLDQRVDFLIAAPWAQGVYVCEIDGEQHSRQQAVDKERDKKLTEVGIKVERYRGRDALSELSKLASKGETSLGGNYIPGLSKALFLPGAVNRIALAIVELLASGHLNAGTAKLTFKNDIDLPLSLITKSLKLLSSIEQLWNISVLPQKFVVGSTSFTCGTGTSKKGVCSVSILLEYLPSAMAPFATSQIPTCIVRSVYVPNDLPVIPQGSQQRRTLDKVTTQNSEAVHVLLEYLFGFKNFREKQLESVFSALSGNDSLVLLPTGVGKSLIYQLAGLVQPGVTIVIDPLKALIDDQVRNLRNRGIENVVGLHSGQKNNSSHDSFTQDLLNSGATILLVAPERLQTPGFRSAMKAIAETSVLNLAVLDEAHCISEWGHDFRVAYLNVARNLRKLGATLDGNTPPILGLTGTASPAVLRDVKREILGGRELVVIEPDSFKRKNLHYQITGSDSPTFDSFLEELFAEELPHVLKRKGKDSKSGLANFPAGIVFVPTVNNSSGIQSTKRAVYQALPFKDQVRADEIISIFSGSAPREENVSKWEETKTFNAERFISDEVPIMVATKAFGMGIDKPNIRWTLHRGFPASIEAFAQESGRAGRDNNDSYCYSVGYVSQPGRVSRLLDTTRSLTERKLEFDSLGMRDDLSSLLFFHYKTFNGADVDLNNAEKVFKTFIGLKSGTPHILSYPGDSDEKDRFERGLYRLSLLGIIEDYEIDYGSRAAIVYLAKYSLSSLKSHALEFLDRLEPGKTSIHEQRVDSVPKELSEAVPYLLKLMLDTHYSVIEPARLRAIQAMFDLCFRSLTGEQIANEIEEYLSTGPLREALNSLVQSPRIDVPLALSTLEVIQLSDASEWIGASSRLLEAFPNHPVLLFSRIIGEALLKQPNIASVSSLMKQMYSQLDEYKVDSDQAVLLHNKLNDVFLEISDPSLLSENLKSMLSSKYGLIPNRGWENTFLERAGFREDCMEFTELVLTKRTQESISKVATFAQEKNR